jgi:hypothetical protein
MILLSHESKKSHDEKLEKYSGRTGIKAETLLWRELDETE